MKRFLAAVIALGVLVFPLLMLSGCAGLKLADYQRTLEIGACLSKSEAVAEIMKKPGAARDLIEEANEAFERIRNGVAVQEDIETILRAQEMVNEAVDCL